MKLKGLGDLKHKSSKEKINLREKWKIEKLEYKTWRDEAWN